ncbi:MAG: hypothetical protein JRN17_01830 [Nitrososphaerota archaeon]|nr:hypothetical protein [Nitrososphaerota archaeon]
MTNSLLVIFSSGTNSDHTIAGLELLRNLSGRKRAMVLLTQDAVLLALKSRSGASDAFGGVSEAYALADHLTKRGFGQDSLMEPFKVLSYDDAVDLIMADGISVVGSF